MTSMFLGEGLPPRDGICPRCGATLRIGADVYRVKRVTYCSQPCAFGEQRIAEARDRGDAGMEQAAGHADRAKDGWTSDAIAVVRALAPQMGPQFTFEELRLRIEGSLPAPPDLRAWGQVARRAIREKVIAPTGQYAPRASGNCTPTMLYTSQERLEGAGMGAP